MNESYDDQAGRLPEAEFSGERERRFEQEPPPRRPRAAHKSVAAAAFLSFLPGAGQVYVGAYSRGLAHMLTFSGIVTILANGTLRGLEPLLGISLAFFVIYNLVDAIRLAQAYNDAVDMGLTRAEPIQLSTNYGSGVGIGLIVIGSLILLETRFGLDLRWIEDWWPVGIILAGVWIVRNSMKRGESEGQA